MATPLKNQFPVAAGTEVHNGKCHGCGGTVFVTISKSAAAYYNCYNLNAATGRPCQGHARWGAADSARIRKGYLERTGQIAAVKVPKPPPDQPANINRAPVRAVQDAPQPATPETPEATESEYDEYGI